MRSARVVAVAGLVAAMTAGVAAPAQASAGPCPQQGKAALSTTSVSYEFRDIAEAVLRVPVPVANVRHLVPARYRLLGEATGTATLLAAHGSVHELIVGCSNGTPATVSEYGVMIESPDPKDGGRHAYYLALLTDNQALISRLSALGVPVQFAQGEFVVQPESGGIRIIAKETWRGDTVELAATGTEPPAGPLVPNAPGVRFWFDGPRGTVRTAYECPNCRPRTGASGSVFGSQGSAVGAILEGNRASGSGFFIRSTLTAAAELNYLEG